MEGEHAGPGAPPSRRHGAVLDAAILEAGFAELAEVGYANLTMGSVAARARTSEPVLYRRWPNKAQLVLAVLDHHRATHPIAVPDTGDLRGDLLTYLGALNTALAGFYPIAAAAALSGLVAATGLSPAALRERAMGAQARPEARAIYRRAADRGELDPAAVPQAVLAVPFDLLRHDLLMGLEPASAERIRTIVDVVFLPLLDRYRTAP